MTLDNWGILITAVAVILSVGIAAYFWRRQRSVSFVVITWVIAAWVLSQIGFFQESGSFTEGDLIGFFAFGTLMTLPILGFIAAYLRNAAFRKAVDDVPLPVLIGMQVYRVAGAIFLWMLAESLVPPELGVSTGIADISIGLAALPLAYALTREWPGSRRAAIAWNVVGIADFAIAISVVFLAVFSLINPQPDPVMIGLHPLALIALFQVPISIILHGLALRRLLAMSTDYDQHVTLTTHKTLTS